MFKKGIRRLAAEVREFRRWETLRSAEDIRVYYGMEHLPTRDERVSGGIVKCLDLAERFPNATVKANLLYLVSSALPDRRELMARAARRAGARIVLNQNGVAYPAWAGKEWREMNALNAWVHGMADFVVYQSEFCRRSAERFLGIRTGPTAVLYNSADTNVFSPRVGFDRIDHMPVLLAAGSHNDAYRAKIAIEALGILRRRGVTAKLVVAGRQVWDPDAEKQARDWAATSGVADLVTFSGTYTQEKAPWLFREADVLVHLQVNDSCPRLVVEAMACGVPVVYSATGGTPELVGEEAGYGIPGDEDFETIRPPSGEDVADGLVHVLARHGTFARMARQRAVRFFSARDWVDAHVHIFESLANGEEKA